MKKKNLSRPAGGRSGAGCAAWLMTGCAGLWLAVFPLVSGFSYARMTRSKWEFMLAFTGLTALMTLAAFFLSGARFPRRDARGTLSRSLREHAAVWAGGCYFLWIALSAAFGAFHDMRNPDGSLTVWIGSGRYEGLCTQLCYFAVFLCLAVRPGRWRPAAVGVGISLLLMEGITLMQYLGLNPLGLYPRGRSVMTNYEFQGTLGNIDTVSSLLSLLIPLVCVPYLRDGASPARILLLAAGILGIELQMMMEVQAGYFALGMGGLLLAWAGMTEAEARPRILIMTGLILAAGAFRLLVSLPWLDGSESLRFSLRKPWAFAALTAGAAGMILLSRVIRRRPWRGLSRRTAAAILAGIVLLFVLAVYLIPFSRDAGWLWEFHEVLGGRAKDSAGSWRIGVWRQAWEMTLEHPLFGGGPDTFFDALQSRLTRLGMAFPENFDNPHNLYLAIAVSYGFPALAAYLCMLALVIRRCFRRPTGRNTALAAAILCHSVQVFFTFSICLVSPVTWCALGLAAGGEYEAES